MSFSRSGPEPTDNVIGDLEFGKWHLYSTSYKEDIWRKPILNMNGYPEHDTYIQIKRVPVTPGERVFYFEIRLHGRQHILLDPLKGLLQGHPLSQDIQDIKNNKKLPIQKKNERISALGNEAIDKYVKNRRDENDHLVEQLGIKIGRAHV